MVLLLCMLLSPLAALAQLRTTPLRMAPGEIGLTAEQYLSKRYPAYVSARPVYKPMLATVKLGSTVPQADRAPLYVSANGAELWGSLISSTAWTEQTKQEGMYSFTSKGTDIEMLVQDSCLNASGGGAYWNNYFYFVSLRSTAYGASVNYYAYSMDDWYKVYEESVSDPGMIALDADIDPNTGYSYGCFYNSEGTGYEFARMKYSTFEKTTICSLSKAWVAVAVDASGTIYAIDTDGVLQKVNASTGALTEVGSTGVKPKYLQSATFDRQTGTLYWAATNTSGQSYLYQVDTSTGKATMIKHFPNDEEFVALYVTTPAPDGAPAKVQDLAASFPNGSYDGDLTFTVPTTTVSGDPLKGDVIYYVIAHRDTIRRDTVAPGTKVTESFTFSDYVFGKQTFTVFCANAAGKGPKANLSLFIGPDTPTAPQNLTLSINSTTMVATLTWDPITVGVNGGYVDPETTTYRIVRYPDGTTLETAYKGTTYNDTLPSRVLNQYYYTVVATYNYKTGAVAKSNAVTAGEAFTVPYLEPFDAASTINIFTIIDGNSDGSTWGYDAVNNAAYYNYNRTNAGNDWLITPAIKLEAGKMYRFSFSARAGMYSGRSLYPERFEAAMGRGNTADDMTTEMVPSTDVTSETAATYSKEFKVDEDGIYYFGIHATSDANMYRLIVDDIAVDFGAAMGAPDSVTNLVATAGANGAMTATLNFNVPTKNLAGTELTSVDSIKIYRNDTTLALISGPKTPGEAVTYTDANVTLNGNNTYRVTCYNSAGEGLSNTVTVFVGQDIPNMPTNVVLKDNNGTLQLTWTAPTEGVNGGYIDVDALTYNIYSYSSRGNLTLLATTEAGVTSYNPEVDMTSEQEFVYYGVSAVNVVGESDVQRSNGVVVGAPYEIPFSESVAGGGVATWVWWSEQVGESGFGFTDELAYDNDGGSFACVFENAGEDAWVNSPKITLLGSTRPTLMFAYYALPGAAVKITPEVNVGTQRVDALDAIDYSKLTGDAGWRVATIDLSAYKNEPYILIQFHAHSDVASGVVVLDYVNVFDMLDYNVAATSISTPATLVAGTASTIEVEVQNMGANVASGYTVDLYVDGELCLSQPGENIATLEKDTVTFTYTHPVVAGKEQVNVMGVVNYDADLNVNDDTTEVRTIKVAMPNLPAIDDLTANTDSLIGLSWTAPTVGDQLEVTDDFESYEPWTTTALAPWTVVDGDASLPYRINGFTYPNSEKAYAFMAFNPANAGADFSEYPELKPHGGDQFLAAFCPSSYYAEQADDWLISPELSGKAQTIKFWAKSYLNDGSEYSYPETFEIMYSTTTADVSSFVALTDGRHADIAGSWTEFTADLPEGTRYFAIHYISADKFAFFVDDATYAIKGPVILGYNIYRDGKLVGTINTAGETTWFDDVPPGTYNYQVTVLYDLGESAPSNLVTVQVSGLHETLARDQRPVNIYTIDGRLVRRNATSLQGLSRGVYLYGNKKVIIP